MPRRGAAPGTPRATALGSPADSQRASGTGPSTATAGPAATSRGARRRHRTSNKSTPPASNTAATTGMALARSSRSGPSAGCGAGVLTLSGITLATKHVAVPPEIESAVPSGPSRQMGGMSRLIGPRVQATTENRTVQPRWAPRWWGPPVAGVRVPTQFPDPHAPTGRCRDRTLERDGVADRRTTRRRRPPVRPQHQRQHGEYHRLIRLARSAKARRSGTPYGTVVSRDTRSMPACTSLRLRSCCMRSAATRMRVRVGA